MRSRFAVTTLLLLALAGCERHGPAAPQAPAAAAPAAPAPEHPMPSPPATVADWARGARLLDGLGDFHRAVTTSSGEAQRYFDQGMRLLWAFNHDESSRSFAQAAALDPHCALCWWGVALTVGPNYNEPAMAEARAKVAVEALGLARANAAGAAPVEQALIEALGTRYPDARPLTESTSGPVLAAYAVAMGRVAERFPDDLDVQTLWAEAMMNVNAWKLWLPDGRPAPGTLQIQATLEKVLARDPRHPGANHYYVHTMEASPSPQSALAAAARLRGMMPAAGHLEHMPAHIFQRVGRYEEAAQANRQGAAADEAYFTRMRPPDYYAMYTAHNYQFLAWSAAMEGRRQEALDAAANALRVASDPQFMLMPHPSWELAAQYAVMVRFGLWDRMLQLPAPDPKARTFTGGYLYGRGMALAAQGRVGEARQVATELARLAGEVPADAPAGLNKARDVLAIAAAVVQSRIAGAEGRSADAIALLRDAVAREDRLAYDEPADWFFPVRHLLGAQLLQAGQAAAAEAVFREDLQRNPDNGWALFGLAESLRRQHRAEAASQAENRFRTAWAHADITLASSAF